MLPGGWPFIVAQVSVPGLSMTLLTAHVWLQTRISQGSNVYRVYRMQQVHALPGSTSRDVQGPLWVHV